MQLNKYIAHAGICSRRNAVVLIKGGKVFVNGTKIYEPSFQVKAEDKVIVNGMQVKLEKKIYILLNKPINYITTTRDEGFNRQTVLDLIGNSIKERIYPVGRLDYNTSGLLILTNDGEFAQKLAHPKYEVEKEYLVKLDQPLSYEHLIAIKSGVKLSDGFIKIDRIFCIPNKGRYQIKISLHSGKYRIVRRLFKTFGYNVIKLDRTAYATLTKKGLRLGEWRFLKANEINELFESKNIQ